MCCTKCEKETDNLGNVTKIPTWLFILFNFLTFSIYGIIKGFRITGDINKNISKSSGVSLVIVAAWTILGLIGYDFWLPNVPTLTTALEHSLIGCVCYTCIITMTVSILLYCHIIYKNLNNLEQIAMENQNKRLKYNKFWAFIFGFLYINFVFNTYNKRLY